MWFSSEPPGWHTRAFLGQFHLLTLCLLGKKHTTLLMLNSAGLYIDEEQQRDVSCLLRFGLPSDLTLLSTVSSSGYGSSLVSHNSIDWHEFEERLGSSLWGLLTLLKQKQHVPWCSETILWWWSSREDIKNQLIIPSSHVKHCLHAGSWRKQSYFPSALPWIALPFLSSPSEEIQGRAVKL